MSIGAYKLAPSVARLGLIPRSCGAGGKRHCGVCVLAPGKFIDRIWSVFFAFPILFTAILLFNLKIIIRTIIIKDLVMSLSEKMTVFINF